MKIIIAIPAYNEGKTISSVINEIKKAVSKTEYDYSIFVTDDGSKDNTPKIAKKEGAHVFLNKRNLGLAETFRNEMKQCLEAGADIIVHTDGDGQYPPEYIPQMIKKIKEGYDLVLGSRFGSGSYSGSFTKKIGNIAFARAFSGILNTKITDTTTGFRAFTAEVASLPIINRFTYTQEQLIRAVNKKMRITEIPITTKKTRPSHLFSNPIIFAARAWINILRIYRDYAPLKFFGSIGLTLLTAGFAIGLYFLYIHFTSGIKGHIGLLFLMILLLTTGMQVVLFGFLADMYTK